MAEDNCVYMFLHIPKTGGSTLRRHLRTQIRPVERFCAYNRQDFNKGAAFFDEPGRAANWKAARVIAGHYVNDSLDQRVGDREIRYITVLREPISRVVSQYNWSFRDAEEDDGTLPQPLEKWLQTPGRWNMQARSVVKTFLQMPWESVRKMPEDELWDIASKTLRDFWLVGQLENLETSMAPLFDALGIPGKITQKQKVAGVHYAKRLQNSPEVAEILAPTCRVDQRLYDEFGLNRS